MVAENQLARGPLLATGQSVRVDLPEASSTGEQELTAGGCREQHR